MLRHLLFIFATSVMLLSTGCERQPEVQASGRIIKLGLVGPFSGDHQAKGQDGIAGVETARAASRLLLNGDAIEIVHVDDRNSPALTTEALRQLGEDDDVAAVLLMSTSDSALHAGAVADKYSLPVVALLATHAGITNGRQYFSQLCFDNTFQGSVAALFARDELLHSNAAVIRNDDSIYSLQLAEDFIRKFRSIGGSITGSYSLKELAGNEANVISSLRKQGTDLLYLPIEARNIIALRKIVTEKGWKPDVMVGDGVLSTAVSQYPGMLEHLQGVYATDFFSSDTPHTPYISKLIDRYNSLFEKSGTSYTLLGIEGYQLLYQAMNRCKQPFDRECINRMIRSTTNMRGISGRISIGSDGKAQRPLYVNSILDGKMKFIVKVY